jgi:hypothetical protein
MRRRQRRRDRLPRRAKQSDWAAETWRIIYIIARPPDRNFL